MFFFFARFFSLCVCFSHKRRENPNKPKSPLSLCEGVSLTKSLIDSHILNNYFKFKYMIWYYFKIKILSKIFLTQGVACALHVQPLLVYIKSSNVQIHNSYCGGQNLSFCVRFKVPFTNNNASEEKKALGKAP